MRIISISRSASVVLQRDNTNNERIFTGKNKLLSIVLLLFSSVSYADIVLDRVRIISELNMSSSMEDQE